MPSTTAILEWVSLNRKLVLVAQMKIRLIFSVLINLQVAESSERISHYIHVVISTLLFIVSTERFSLVTWRFNKLFGLITSEIKGI